MERRGLLERSQTPREALYSAIVSYRTVEDELEIELNDTPKSNELKNRVSGRKKAIALIVLFLLNFLNYTDRYLVSAVLIDVQTYFEITKSFAGLLHSGFLLSFTLGAPIVGYFGDRYPRAPLLVFSGCFWLVSIIAGSFVTPDQFTLFLASRCAFGLASAFYECLSLPIISDLFEDSPVIVRTRALFLFYLGPPLGTGLAFLLATYTRTLFPDDWRFALRGTPFILCPLIIILPFLFRTESTRPTRRRPNSYMKDLKSLILNRTYVLMVLASSCAITALVGFNWWAPSYIEYFLESAGNTRKSISSTKQIYSVFQVIFGLIGTLLPSELSNLARRLKPKLFEANCFLLSGGIFASSLTLYLYFATADSSPYLDIVLYSFYALFANSWRILLANILLEIVVEEQRATANSILLLALHLLGDSMAPLWIGSISDKCLSDSINPVVSLSIEDYVFCVQVSLYPLVFLLIVGASFALFASLTIRRDLVARSV